MNEHIFKESVQALNMLIEGNRLYIESFQNPSHISQQKRHDTTRDGQKPYAAILACSDSRVPPEHIFSAGIGDLFVVRTAGNVVGTFELGSIEFAVQYLDVRLIIILGHNHCGAVTAALEGQADGYISSIVHEIKLGLGGATTESDAISNNITHSKERILQSATVREWIDYGELMVLGAIYDVQTGYVDFWHENKRKYEAELDHNHH